MLRAEITWAVVWYDAKMSSQTAVAPVRDLPRIFRYVLCAELDGEMRKASSPEALPVGLRMLMDLRDCDTSDKILEMKGKVKRAEIDGFEGPYLPSVQTEMLMWIGLFWDAVRIYNQEEVNSKAAKRAFESATRSVDFQLREPIPDEPIDQGPCILRDNISGVTVQALNFAAAWAGFFRLTKDMPRMNFQIVPKKGTVRYSLIGVEGRMSGRKMKYIDGDNHMVGEPKYFDANGNEIEKPAATLDVRDIFIGTDD
jgi:hypothetical protein